MMAYFVPIRWLLTVPLAEAATTSSALVARDPAEAPGRWRGRGTDVLDKGFRRSGATIMNIGNLKKNEAGIHMGRITTLSIGIFVALSAVNSTNDKAPAYDVMALAADKRSWVKVGALWAFTSNATGEEFLSGRIDDPSMDKAIEVQLFRQDDGSYNVAWRRPVRRANLPSVAAGESGDDLPALPGGDGGGSDQGGAAATGDGLGKSTAPAAGKARTKERELVDA